MNKKIPGNLIDIRPEWDLKEQFRSSKKTKKRFRYQLKSLPFMKMTGIGFY